MMCTEFDLREAHGVFSAPVSAHPLGDLILGIDLRSELRECGGGDRVGVRFWVLSTLHRLGCNSTRPVEDLAESTILMDHDGDVIVGNVARSLARGWRQGGRTQILRALCRSVAMTTFCR